MKKTILVSLMVFVVTAFATNVFAQTQTKYTLSSEFSKNFTELQKIEKQHPQSWAGYDSVVLNLQVRIATAALKCINSVENEADFIMLYSHCSGLEPYVPNPIVADEKANYPDNISSAVTALLKMEIEYNTLFRKSKYYQQATMFVMNEIASANHITIERDSESISGFKQVVHFKKRIAEYSALEIFWLAELFDDAAGMTFINPSVPDISKEDGKVILQKMKQTGFEPLVTEFAEN